MVFVRSIGRACIEDKEFARNRVRRCRIRIAQAQSIDRAVVTTSGVVERIIIRNRTIRINPEDLSCIGTETLYMIASSVSTAGIPSITGSHVELAITAKDNSPSIVTSARAQWVTIKRHL